MRTQLELWQVVKDNFDEYFETGLCLLIRTLKLCSIISFEEMKSLTDELKKNGNTRDFFLGNQGYPKPRLEFINSAVKPLFIYGMGCKAKIIISIRYLVVWNNFCIFTKNKKLA